jgi:ATP-dependent helicase/DNAse subunit B
MIKLLYGPPENENNKKISNKIIKLIQSGKSESLTYISPTYQMIKDLKDDIFSHSEIEITGSTNFLLFKGFINEVLKDSTQFKPIISRVQRELILKEVTEELIRTDKITYFEGIAKYPGFYEDLLNLIKEISLENEIENSQFLENINNQKFKEIFIIYNNYYNYLKKNNLKDDYLQYEAAINNLEKSEMVDKLEFIIVDGFQDFNLYQKKILNKLSELGKEVWINRNFEKDRPGIYNSEDELNKKLNISKKEKGITLSLNNNNLEHLRDNLFTIDYDKKPFEDILDIISAEDEDTEIRYIAREIKRLIHERGVIPEDIGLIVKSQVKYFELIDEVFNEYQIPYYTSNSTTFKQTGLWILLNQIFDVIRNEYDRKSVIKLVKSNFTDLGLQKDELEKIQLKIWDDGIIKGQDFSYIFDDAKQEYPDKFKEAVKKIIKFQRRIEKANSFSVYSTPILDLLESFNIVNSIINFTDQDLIIQELKAFDILKTKLEEYSEIITGSLQFEEYVYWFKKIFKEEMISKDTTENVSRVKVLTPSQARRKKFDYMFIPGLLEGEFPGVNRNRWLVKDKERKILENMQLNIRTKNDLLILESYLYYKNILNTNQKLYLTYPTLGEGEGGEIISSFVEEVKNLFKKDTINKVQVKSFDLETTNLSEIYSLKELKDYAVKELEEKSLINLLPSYKIEKLRDSKEYNNVDGLIDDPEILQELKKHFNKNYSYSPSSLETYVQCPFKFFIKKVLKLEEIKEPEDRLEAMQIGDLYHKILFDYFTNQFPGSWSEELEDYQSGMVESAERIFSNYEGKKTLPKGIWRIYREEIIENLKQLIEKEYKNDFQTLPFKLEYGFGLPAKYQDSTENREDPVSIELNNQSIKLKGKIDRIDRRRNNEGIIIYDYKLSNKRGRTKDFFEFNELQIPFYILALQKIIPEKQLMGGAYYSVLKPSKNGIWKKDFVEFSPKTNRSSTVMSVGNWERYFLDLKDKIEEVINGIKSGDFRLDPKDCDYCDGSHICRYNKMRVGDIVE